MRPCLVLVLIALALAACGGEGDDSRSAETASTEAASTEAPPPTTEATTPTTDAATTESSPETDTATTEAAPETNPATDELAAVAQSWYAQADPAVCERMTKALLDFGWGRTGKAGVAKCKRNLEQADPVQDVVIDEVTIDGSSGTVTVSYTLEGDQRTDRIHFVRRNAKWLMNEVAVVVEEVPVPETDPEEAA